MKPQDFAGQTPEFKLEEYFLGKTEAWGIFEDRFGTLRRQFTVDIEGTWDEATQTLTLVEDFLYNDGETEQRIWVIRKTGAHSYQGTAGDVEGVAEGEAYGNALNWRYQLNLKVGDGTWLVGFDDWMWQQPGGVVINRATVTKLGVELGQVTVFFKKP